MTLISRHADVKDELRDYGQTSLSDERYTMI
jgi:hypothetical protein